MTWTPERTITRGQLEAVIDRDVATQELRVGIYKGDTLLAIKFIPSLETEIDRQFSLAAERSPAFPNGE